MFTATQLVLHGIGDYVLQSDWMAAEKTKKNWAAAAHAIMYTLPFFLIANTVTAMLVIGVTHFIIDRWRLARYVCWLKNFLSPRFTLTTPTTGDVWWHPWSECVGTGYHRDRPAWMAVWLMIITDNLMHVTINAFALRYL